MLIGDVTTAATNGVNGAEAPATDGAASAEPAEKLSPDPMAQLALSDDAIYEIAALVAQGASNDRKSARAMRNAQEKVVEAETAHRIESMLDKAAATRMAAMISGISGMAAGACQIVGGLSAASQASKIQTSGKDITPMTNQETGAMGFNGQLTSTQVAENQIVNNNASAANQIGGGASGCLQSSGGLVSGFLHAEETECDAGAAKHEARAGRATRAVEDCGNEMKDAKQLLDKVMDFLKEVRATQNATAQNAIRA